jgi:ubiquitin-conjugating enzyme E2 J2
MATKRLRKELILLQTDPPPGIIAEPDESNILKWYYAIRGPSETPFEDGIYVGKLTFPSTYPMQAPSITMCTPSGRFVPNQRICMSMSDFHPESWNPMWSVSKIIQGIQSFMASDELTTGGLKSPKSEHLKLAKLSIEYNQKMFPKLFDGDIVGAMNSADQISQKVEKETAERVKENESNSGDAGGGGSRAARRAARRAAAATTNNQESNDAEGGEQEDAVVEEDGKQELTPAEIERRRKKNAQKRAKQKAKKATAAAQASGDAGGSEETATTAEDQ